MKKRKKYNKIYKLLFIFSIIFIVIIIYFYNDNILVLKELSTSIFNLKEDKYKSKENNEINELKKEIKELKEINNINKSNIEYNYVDASIIKRNKDDRLFLFSYLYKLHIH